MPLIAEILAAFRAGNRTRERFWTDMADHHLALRQYHSLLSQGEVAAIEIDAEELRIVTSGGLKFAWQPEDLRSAPNVALNYGAYEPQESGVLLAAARRSEIVFDIGLNYGWYAVHFAQLLTGSQPKVHGFEPVPATCAQARRNVALNGFEQRILVNNFGLSSKPGTLTMFVPEFQGSSAASLRNLHPEDKSVEVQVELTTLDAYAAEQGIARLDLIKCDVEGAELFVIQGGLGSIRRHRPIIFMELLRKWSKPFGYHPNDVIDLLADAGYQCWTFAEDGSLEPMLAMTDDTRQTNFLFLDPAKHEDFRASLENGG